MAAITANLRNADIRAVQDGDELTVWNAGQLQRGNESVTMDLGRPRRVDVVQLDLGPYVQDFPRALAVDCAAEAGAWMDCWHGSTAAAALRGILSDPARAPITIPIQRDGVRFIRLRQTAVDNLNGWSIAELLVFGA